MAKNQSTPTTSNANINTNTNVNTNVNKNVNKNINKNTIHVHVPHPEKKQTQPNWLKRIIVGGIITTLLSVGGYYLKKKIDAKSSIDPTDIQSKVPPVVETTKK